MKHTNKVKIMVVLKCSGGDMYIRPATSEELFKNIGDKTVKNISDHNEDVIITDIGSIESIRFNNQK